MWSIVECVCEFVCVCLLRKRHKRKENKRKRDVTIPLNKFGIGWCVRWWWWHTHLFPPLPIPPFTPPKRGSCSVGTTLAFTSQHTHLRDYHISQSLPSWILLVSGASTVWNGFTPYRSGLLHIAVKSSSVCSWYQHVPLFDSHCLVNDIFSHVFRLGSCLLAHHRLRCCNAERRPSLTECHWSTKAPNILLSKCTLCLFHISVVILVKSSTSAYLLCLNSAIPLPQLPFFFNFSTDFLRCHTFTHSMHSVLLFLLV